MPMVPPSRRIARLGLIIAALLHLLGAAAGPGAHLLPELEGMAAVDAGAPAEGESSSPHDELACAACHVLGALGLPPASTTAVAALETAGADAARSPENGPSSLDLPSAAARAPPM